MKATYGHEWDKDGNYKPQWITLELHQEIIERLKNCHNCAKQETCSLISHVCKEWEMR